MVDLPRASRLFGWAVDGAPGVVFLLAYLVTRDFRVATLFLVTAAAVALSASVIVERRLRPLPAVTGALAVLFGGASLLLHNPDILKMKMTIVDGLLGATLLVGVAVKKNPLKMILGATFSLPDKAWATLAIRYGHVLVGVRARQRNRPPHPKRAHLGAVPRGGPGRGGRVRPGPGPLSAQTQRCGRQGRGSAP